MLTARIAFAETTLVQTAQIAQRTEPNVFQFGIAIAGKFALSSPFCRSGTTCVLGSGGGIAARFGHVFRERWYIGGGYDFSKHDASLLYRLGILQQVRADGRYQYPLGKAWFLVPFSSLGVSGYGNEWTIDTWGPSLTVGTAVEAHVANSVVGVGFSWQGIYLQRLANPGQPGEFFSAGFPQFFSLELRLESTERF